MSPEKEQPTYEPGSLAGFELPADFSMPTTAEIEQILALGDRSWNSVLGTARWLRPLDGGRHSSKDGE
jgi:hypothetical protein